MTLEVTLPPTLTVAEIAQRLRDRGITPTRQRLWIAQILFASERHLSAQDVYRRVNRQTCLCRATVYNTLHRFVAQGLVRRIAVDIGCAFYDTHLQPHYHMYNVDTGELRDIDPDDVAFQRLPPLPAGLRREQVALIVRVRGDGRLEGSD